MIKTHDIFLAAYLKSLPFTCQVEIEKTDKGVRFQIAGEKIFEHEVFYRQGWAVVALVDFQQAFYQLLDQSEQAIRPIN